MFPGVVAVQNAEDAGSAGVQGRVVLDALSSPIVNSRSSGLHFKTVYHAVVHLIFIYAISIKANILEIGGEQDVEKGLQRAIDAKDSVGGIIECRATGLPIGLGEPFFDSVESVLSHAVFAIPAVRGIEFGTGFAAARMFGSIHNDAIENAEGKTSTNHAGGVVGGITNGNELVFRIAIKPTSSTPNNTCLCRLLSSTTSKSTIPILPTPAAAR